MNIRLTNAEIEAARVAEDFEDASAMYRYAPSLFATTAHPKMSSKYAFTNTYDILLHMHNRGFKVTSVMGGADTYRKVMVRMRNTNYDKRDNMPELVVLDSHDGSSRLKIALGIMRLICMNGCIAGDMFYSRAFMHRSPDLMAQVMLELEDIDAHVMKLNKRVDVMKSYNTNIGERLALADSAVKERWGDDKDGSFVADMRQRLLQIRRNEDDSNDMYTVMNVIQENVLRGGMNYVTSNNRVSNVRSISDVRRNVNINQRLWNEAEQLLQKAA